MIVKKQSNETLKAHKWPVQSDTWRNWKVKQKAIENIFWMSIIILILIINMKNDPLDNPLDNPLKLWNDQLKARMRGWKRHMIVLISISKKARENIFWIMSIFQKSQKT